MRKSTHVIIQAVGVGLNLTGIVLHSILHSYGFVALHLLFLAAGLHLLLEVSKGLDTEEKDEQE